LLRHALMGEKDERCWSATAEADNYCVETQLCSLYSYYLLPMAPPFFSDSPNARSKSITAADLDTYGVRLVLLCRVDVPLIPALDPQSSFHKPPHISRRALC
jgi:hypothetical protein